jgi:hypothetical protein
MMGIMRIMIVIKKALRFHYEYAEIIQHKFKLIIPSILDVKYYALLGSLLGSSVIKFSLHCLVLEIINLPEALKMP